MAYYGDPRETLRAEYLTKTWKVNLTRHEANEAHEKLRISVAEFKSFVTNLVLSKNGALPDVRDWKEIKKQLDKLEALEIEVQTKAERAANTKERFDELSQLISAEQEYEAGNFYRDAYQNQEADIFYFDNDGVSALAPSESGHVYGYTERNKRNNHGWVK